MDNKLHKDLDDLRLILDTDFAHEVRKVAGWLRPKKLNDDLGTGDTLARMLLDKAETITPEEVRLLACLVSGKLCFDERLKCDWRTTDQQIDIYIRVKKEQLKFKQSSKAAPYASAIKNIANKEGVGIKAIERYCTNVAKTLKCMTQTNSKITDKKIRQAMDLYTLLNKKNA